MKRLPALLAAALFCAAPLRAQEARLGAEGRLSDEAGRPISGACLLDFALRGQESSEVFWRESRYVSVREGRWSSELGTLAALPPLPASGWRVEASAPWGTGWRVALDSARLLEAASQVPTAPTVFPPSAPAAAAVEPLPPAPAPPPPAAAAPRPRTPAPREDERLRRLEQELRRSNEEAARARARLESVERSLQTGAAQRIYEVLPGDTLRSIAQKLYGDPDRWTELYEANSDRLQRGGDPLPGQRLVAPPPR